MQPHLVIGLGLCVALAGCKKGDEPEPRGRVLMETGIGGKRIVDVPAGELLPRIC